MLWAFNMKELGFLGSFACDKICKNVLFLWSLGIEEKNSIGSLLPKQVELFFHTLGSENPPFHNQECFPPKLGAGDGAGRSIA